MKLPRRVPWSSLQELDQVCSWIYTDENDIDAKIRAVQRMAAWKNITSLPHALESTHAILSAIIQDASLSSSTRAISSLSLRQNYATALIRLVNGLVDPLQLGAYARSISSIASQLGLSPWLVELRHAATHEDLPSLECLREASRDAMTWLLNNYFLPTLYPTTQPTSYSPPLRPLAPILKEYKNILKITTRDVSLRSHYQPEITKILRDVERWITEAKVAANISAGALDWDLSGNVTAEDSEIDPKERWALEKFCDSLLEKGLLVPLSRKKRIITAGLGPPASSVAIWTPLITHLEALHPSLSSVLVFRVVSHLLPTPQVSQEAQEEETMLLSAEVSKQDSSYDFCLASWAKHLVDTREVDTYDGGNETTLKRSEVIATILSGLGPQKSRSADEEKGARALLTALYANRPDLQDLSAVLLSPTIAVPSNKVWNERDIDSMNERLRNLMTTMRSPHSSTTNMDTNQNNSPRPTNDNGGNSFIQPHSSASLSAENPMDMDVPLTFAEESFSGLPPGWRRLNEREGWRPAPIGVCVRAVPTN